MGDTVQKDLKLYNNNNNGDEATSRTSLLSQQPQSGYDSLSAVVPAAVRNDSGSSRQAVVHNNNRHVIGRALLVTVAFLYGTLNVSLRWIYSLPGHPSASALSTTRGWLAVVCFVPFLLAKKNVDDQTRRKSKENAVRVPATNDHRSLSRKSVELEVVNNGASHSQNGNSQENDAVTSQTQQQQQQQVPPAITNTNRSRSFWKTSMELAVFNFASQALINLGLLSVASARAAFLTQTSVVITPVVSALVGHHVHPKVWLACLAALGGLLLMSHEDGESGLGHFQLGDLLCLGGALCWSLYISRLSYCESFDEIEMQAAKTFFLAVLYTGWLVAAFIQSETCLWQGWTSLAAWALLFYSALGPGTLADVMQQKGQGTVTAAEANVILSMEPVFTAIMGRLFLGEVTSLQDRFGGGLIILAALIATT
jgi:drug/metabolite transporter (DMT)-like permease